MDEADEAYVFFNPKTIEHKRLSPITTQEVAEAFVSEGLQVFTDPEALFQQLRAKTWEHQNLLIMTSGNFSGQDLKAFATEITGNPVKFERKDNWLQHPDGMMS